MSKFPPHLPDLEAQLDALQTARYATAADGAREVAWMAPGVRSAPSRILRRVKALCSQHEQLFTVLFVIAATHTSTPREMLVKAIRQYRRDAETLSESDLTALLVSAGNGGLQGFEAVLRARKNAARKASTLPWGGSA